MGKRTRFLTSEDCLPDNVISLEKYRHNRWPQHQVHLLYIGDQLSGASLSVLKNCTHAVQVAQGEESLGHLLGTFIPNIILIESGLSWIDPVALTCTLAQMTSAPLVMVCTRNTRKADRPGLLKRAFAVGLQDTLQMPLRKEDLEETFRVLLKYHSVAASL